MPELVDVEGFRRVLTEHALRREVRRVDVVDAHVVRGVSGRRFAGTVRGRSFTRGTRHGKWLVAELSGSGDLAVLMHFGMTGSLEWADLGDPRHRHDRLAFELGDGELRYRDMRKLTGLRLADGATRDDLLGELGPDAAGLSPVDLATRVGRTRRQLKPALLDQAVVAGLGNELADEILWRARLHPRTQTRHLAESDFRRVHRRMRTVFRRAIPAGRIPRRAGWLTRHRRDEQADCPRCGTRLRNTAIGGRSTIWCPRCQPEPS